jgi:acyl carrier protein
MELDQIKTELRDILKNRLDLVLDGPEPDDNGNLFTEWGIDSVDVLDLVLAIEQEFGVKIKQGDDNVNANFENISKLATYIESRVTETA